MKNKEFFAEYIKIFLEENSKVNLISKNEEKFLWEKHIFDSLALELFFNKYGIPKTLLDIGTGGGFPSVPLALANPEIQVTALDSIAKKIRAVQSFKDKLDIKNLTPVCERVENFNKRFDVVTSRAVASLDKVCAYAFPKLNKGGYIVTFKSKKALEEIHLTEKVLNKHNAKVIDIINYDLPLENRFDRCLIVIK